MTTLDHEPENQPETGLIAALNSSSTTAPGIGDLRNEALRRKERLIQMRKQARGETETPSTDSTESGDLPKPIFRNYRPVSEDLKPGQLPDSSMVNCE
ncbi:unnamed protein product [Dibothriocephalus latus]|uniref:Uncharacterized protein n=1 Tax=Dibothriocephalus latus TaxID=60516 RepID=A0A3P7MQ57_DIBLA|nr:unnamed protein product [Dibothriocephalus latus]